MTTKEETRTLIVMFSVPKTSAHVTLAFRADCTDDECSQLILDTYSLFSRTGSFECRIGEELIKVGKQGELDAYPVSVIDKEKRAVLQKFWTRQQRRQTGERMFPFNLHVTLNTAAKKKELTVLAGSQFVVKEVYIRTLLTKEVIVYVRR